MKAPTISLISLTLAVLLCGLSLLLAACSPRYPLGIPEAQWQQMSQEEQLRAREHQAELDRALAERRAAEARAREAEALRQQAELAALRSQAAYGERIQCVLSGEAHLAGNWRSIEVLPLDLVRGYEQEFLIREAAGHRQARNYASFDGQVLQLCQRKGGGGQCIKVVGTQADYHRGLNEALQTEGYLRGHLHCDLVASEELLRRPAQRR